MRTNPDSRLNIFATRVKMLREERGWTQEQLAARLGTTKSLICYYENAAREPKMTMLAKMTDVFDETAEYLMGGTNIRRLKKIAN